MIKNEKKEGDWSQVFLMTAAFLAVELSLSLMTGMLLYSGF